MLSFSLIIVLARCVSSGTGDSGSCGTHGSRPTMVDDVVNSFVVKDLNMWDALGGLDDCMNANLNIGTIYYDYIVHQESIQPKLNLALGSTTVRGVLDALMAADTSYYWVADGFVINLIPRVHHPNFDVVTLLEQRLNKFKVTQEYMDDAVSELVTQAIAQGARGLVGPSKTSPDMQAEQRGLIPQSGIKISISLRNKTVRECLNAIVAADPPAYWIAQPTVPFGYVRINALASHGHVFKYPQPNQRELDEILRLMREMNELGRKQREGTITEREARQYKKKIKRYNEIWEKYPERR